MHFREFLNNFAPYEWEPSNEQIASKYNISPDDIIRLDTNTSPYSPNKWLQKLASIMEGLPVQQYPDASYSKVRKLISDYTEFSMDQIILANGADENLLMIGSSIIDPNSDVILSTPTYAYYSKLVEILGANVVSVNRKDDFSDNFDAIISSINENTSAVILCNPNNPTGNIVDRSKVVELLENKNITVVVDEAYYEYTGITLSDLINSNDNLVIVRTFSKAFSLAGLRVGYSISSPKMTNIINKVRPPNSVGVISNALAEIALSDLESMKEVVNKTLVEKKRFLEKVSAYEQINIIPGAANFMLLSLNGFDGSDLCTKLLERGIVVRDVSSYENLGSYIRFSLGTSDQNDKFLSCLLDF
ncbi:MAG: histidinol-phosphate transaminase [Thermoproteota archaeon]